MTPSKKPTTARMEGRHHAKEYAAASPPPGPHAGSTPSELEERGHATWAATPRGHVSQREDSHRVPPRAREGRGGGATRSRGRREEEGETI